MKLTWNEQKQLAKEDKQRHAEGRPVQPHELTGRKTKTRRLERKRARKVARRLTKRAA